VTELLTITMKHLSNSPRQQTRMLIVGTCDEAVKAGRLARHNLADIGLADHGPKNLHADFVFPSYEQVKFVADGGMNPATGRVVGGTGLCVWLMRGCGLRIEEALAVSKEDFIEDGTVLRVMWQASRDGRKREPLKHRKTGEYRDVPVPTTKVCRQCGLGWVEEPATDERYQRCGLAAAGLAALRVEHPGLECAYSAVTCGTPYLSGRPLAQVSWAATSSKRSALTCKQADICRARLSRGVQSSGI
jgi:hypothetical protein